MRDPRSQSSPQPTPQLTTIVAGHEVIRTAVIEAFEREQNISGTQSAEDIFQLEFPQSQSTPISKFIASFRITPYAFISILLWPIKSTFADILALIPPESEGPSEFPDGTLKIPLFYLESILNASLPPRFVLLSQLSEQSPRFVIIFRPYSLLNCLYLTSLESVLFECFPLLYHHT